MSGEPESKGFSEDLGDVVFDATKIATIEERSDVDPHSKLDKGDLGEDWGDGFYVQEEPVIVIRGPGGVIQRTVPLSEAAGLEERHRPLTEDEIVTGEPIEKPHPLPREARWKLVEVLAGRLVKEYRNRLIAGDPAKWNPYRDGIPKSMMSYSPHALQPLPGTDMIPATDGEVFEFFKRIVGERVKVIEKNKGFGDYRDLSLRIER